MLLAQMRENKKLKSQLQEAQTALADRRICVAESGTLAEAALRLNQVFEAADQAARQYLENVCQIAPESGGEL